MTVPVLISLVPERANAVSASSTIYHGKNYLPAVFLTRRKKHIIDLFKNSSKTTADLLRHSEVLRRIP